MIELDGERLTIEDVVAVGRDGASLAPLREDVSARMQRSYEWLQRAVGRDGRTIYGVNTGFGGLAQTHIPAELTGKLSRNVIVKCVAGVGDPLDPELVRAMMLVRANSLARGVSGVRPALVDTLIAMLNAGVTPWVPAKGSLGASGDLAPLASIAAVVTRDVEEGDGGYSGRAWLDGELMSGAEAMEHAGIPRLVPEAKDGLGLTNGTAMMVGAGALAVHDAERLLRHAEVSAALSMEALMARSHAFHPALHEANAQPGQIRTAANLRSLLAGSGLIDAQPDRVQDAYSVRCTPQVLGPARDVLAFLRDRFTAAINAASDNPLVFTDLPGGTARALQGGNFHGQGPAMWLDFLGIAIAEVAGIAERRIFRLLTPELSGGLPPMLVEAPGLNSGLMVAQYTAAALVSDNKTLAHPDSVDSIPSSANQEDHVSMGANAARHCREILENVRFVLAIELLAAAQGVDLREGGVERLAPATAAAHRIVRERVRHLEADRELTPDIEALADLIRSGQLIEAAAPHFDSVERSPERR
jgi:histidine ammonia-lyase